MMEGNEYPTGVIQGDCLEMLRTLPDGFVDCCVTSPPYYGLRDYGMYKQIGLEETPEEYIQKLIDVFHEVRRVLKDDGTLWVNIGDSYSGLNTDSCKRKDLIGIPWMLAFALRDDGWYLRQDIIWHKPNPMPESVKDRCTKSHEYIFLLSKQQNYYFDYEAIQEYATGYDGRKDTRNKGSKKYSDMSYFPGGNHQTMAMKGHERWQYKNLADKGQIPNTMHLRGAGGEKDVVYPVRNKRDVWTVPTRPIKEAHFATFPEELIRPCILSGSRSGGIVLDPFFGSGTTGRVAISMNRKYLGIELNPEYIEIEKLRTNCVQMSFEGLMTA